MIGLMIYEDFLHGSARYCKKTIYRYESVQVEINNIYLFEDSDNIQRPRIRYGIVLFLTNKTSSRMKDDTSSLGLFIYNLFISLSMY